jgi:trimeric autotransporter adhesin
MYFQELDRVADAAIRGRGEVAARRNREIHGRTMPVRRVSMRRALGIVGLSLSLSAFAGTAPAQDFRIIDRFAGGSNGDGGPAAGATLNPNDLVVDAVGNVFIADTGNHRIRKVDAVTGFISTVAGTGVAGYSGDGGPATEADLSGPVDVEIDAVGNLYISDRGNQRVRKVDVVTGIITTVAGTGSPGFSGDNGPATSAQLNSPGGVAVDSDGSIYIADTSNNRIRKVLPGGGIRTYAGNGTFGFAGDGGPASSARLALPADVTIGPVGDLYIADFANQRVRVVHKSTERIFTAAGSGQFSICDNVVPEEACFRNPLAVVYDPTENVLFLADAANHRVRRIPLSSGIVTTIAGTGVNGYNGDGILAAEAWLEGPSGVGVHPTLGVFIGDQFNHRVRRVPRGGNPLIQTAAGNGNLPYAGDGGPALAAKFNNPAGIAFDSLDNFYIADSENHRIRRIAADGTVSTVAGSGVSGYAGDNGNALLARLASPTDVVADRSGNLYIADKNNHRVRRVSPSGVITTLLGTGAAASTGDGGAATSAATLQPSSLAIYENDSGTQRSLYVLESAQHKVRVVNLNTNVVNRFAGTGTFGFSGDGGQAAAANLAVPLDIAADDRGNVYIADTANQRVRRVASNGVISTIAGTGSFGFDGDGGLAISAKLGGPDGVAADTFGNVMIIDSGNRRIRLIDSTGVIQTIAGTGYQTGRIDGEGGDPLDDLGDGGPSTDASFSTMRSVTFDGSGNGFICDSQAATVRWIEDLSGLFSPDAPQSGVSGTVRYATGLALVPGVTIQASGPRTTSASTASSGAYDFDALESAPWLLEPVKTGDFGSSEVITPLDAAYVLQDLVHLRTLTSAQRLACDVTGDGDLSPLDATRILQRALGSATPFAAAVNCGSEWLFEPDAASAANQTQIEPLLDSGTTCRRGAIQFNPLSGEPTRQDFIAVIIGDCTANWTPSGGATSGAATSALARRAAAGGSSVLIGPERRTRHTVRIPISIDGDGSFSALQIDLGFDAGALRPKRIVRRGAARNAIVGWRETAPGELTLVLAASSEIATPARTVLILDFEVTGTATRGAVRSARARIDESEAGVRLARRGQRR